MRRFEKLRSTITRAQCANFRVIREKLEVLLYENIDEHGILQKGVYEVQCIHGISVN